jgi:hypothetical protein
MKKMNIYRLLIILAIFSFASVISFSGSVSASSVDPTWVPDNPNCADLGYDHEYKIEAQPYAGTYVIDSAGNSITVFNEDRTGGESYSFNWSSTLGMDAVFVKAGNGGNLYAYNPESFGDLDVLTVESLGISHISFCYDYELDVSKTANTSFDRTYEWTIEKSVNPDVWDLPKHGSGTSFYEVTVTKTGHTDSNWTVAGGITIHNPSPFTATISSVQDVVSPSIAASVDCGVTLPYGLVSGGTLVCSYDADLPDGNNRTNEVDVLTIGDIQGDSAQASVDFSTASITEIDNEITVSDSNLTLTWGPVNETTTWNYDLTFDCSSVEWQGNTATYQVPNTATINETQQYDDANVTVNCHDYELDVSKTANTSLTRTYEWAIDKSVDPSLWDLFIGNTGQSQYTVSVDQTGHTDSAFAVAGGITITNPAPSQFSAIITSVDDVVDGVIAGVDCGVSFPYELIGGATLNCTYLAGLSDGTERTNTATVAVDPESFVQGGEGTANVSFASPTITEVNASINVTDTNGEAWSASGDKTWTYTKTFDCSQGAGSYTHDNTAIITETGQADDALVTVNCYEIEVNKDASTSFDRTYEWDIEKSVNPDLWNLSKYGSGTSFYEVTVTKTGSTDSDWAVNGNITIHNPAPFGAKIAEVNNVMDSVSGIGFVSVDCGVIFPYVIPAGDSLACTYGSDLPDGSNRTNTATASLQNYAIDYLGGMTPIGSTDYSGSANIDFTTAIVTEINNEITVSDTNLGITWGPVSSSTTWEYDLTFDCSSVNWQGSFATYDVPNTATILETQQEASASVTVNCHDYELDVTKTAETSLTRTWDWTIEKSVTPDNWNLFMGNTGQSQYTVSVDKTGFTDSKWAVAGTITIANPAPAEFDTIITSVDDVVNGTVAGVDCGVDFPYVLPGGATLECVYSTPLSDGVERINTATVAVDTESFVQGGEGTAPVSFANPIITEVNPSINVTDTNGEGWAASDAATWTYTRIFACGDDEGIHDNIATITETGQADNATVTVNCYEIEVSKDANPSFDRQYDWIIDKVADQTNLTLSIGQQFLVNYGVSVSSTGFSDSNYTVAGTITVHNPAPFDAELTSVADVITDIGSVSVDCPSYIVPAAGDLICSYESALSDGVNRVNTATASLQNYAIDYLGGMTPIGSTDYTGSADIDFTSATMNEIDECIDVDDTNLGAPLGTVCYGESPTTFNYSKWVGPYEVCGTYIYDNTAGFITNDTQTAGNDTWDITVEVPCDGCSLTPGYWKTHSIFGPAPYDGTWALLPSGENTMFFLSGQTYYDVLHTPSAGNIYYILAPTYIAAELNGLNGSDLSVIADTMADAAAIFNEHTPDDLSKLKGKNGKALRAEILALATILDDYNNGLIGPGHCSEENPEAFTALDLTATIAGDSDNDGLSDDSEVLFWGTDPNNPDTDGDGYLDGAEVESGYNPLGPGLIDSDNDGLTDVEEAQIGTDPNNPDSDGDGYSDGIEVQNGYDPLN